jgi:hypothetical protein
MFACVRDKPSKLREEKSQALSLGAPLSASCKAVVFYTGYAYTPHPPFQKTF